VGFEPTTRGIRIRLMPLGVLDAVGAQLPGRALQRTNIRQADENDVRDSLDDSGGCDRDGSVVGLDYLVPDGDVLADKYVTVLLGGWLRNLRHGNHRIIRTIRESQEKSSVG
jgi:hypothetical protein